MSDAVVQPALAARPRASRALAWRRYLEIILFKAYADLRAERQRTYLGFLWWLFEPLLFMAVMWVVFDRILHLKTDDSILFLLTGLVFWQWIKSSISHGSASVLGAASLIRLVPLPPALFPLVTVLADTFKFSLVLLVLLLVLTLTGHTHSITMLGLPMVLLAVFSFICAATLWAAAFVPFLPDLRFVIENGLMALMFLSGIFFDADMIPAEQRQYFYYNPTAFLLREARDVLLRQHWPSWDTLALFTAACLLCSIVAVLVIERLRPLYPKLPS